MDARPPRRSARVAIGDAMNRVVPVVVKTIAALGVAAPLVAWVVGSVRGYRETADGALLLHVDDPGFRLTVLDETR